MARNDVFLNINALSPADAVVTGQQDMTAATVPELVLGDTPTFNFYFTDNTNVWPSWAGNASYTLTWALSDAVAGDFTPAATTADATPITGGWSVVLPLNAYDLVGLLNTKRVGQPYPVQNLWQQLRVADPSGNEVTRAMFWTPVRYRAISDTQNTESASPTGGRFVTVDTVNALQSPNATSFYAANPVPTSALGTAANGELLIGNGTGFVKSTLTAGTGITVTNAAGAITIDATTAQEVLTATVTNAESVAITKGQVVYIFGATGNRPSVKLAFNTTDATSAKTFGVVSDTSISAGGTGTVTCVGVITGLNLAAYNDGDTVYLGATPGSVTNVKPYAPNHLVYVGIIERANMGNGELYVRIQNGYELDEIHDVQINAPRQSGQTLIYDNTLSLWKNARITAGTNIGVTNGDSSITIGFSGTLPVANGGTGVTTSTGSGSVVLSTSPTLTTPILGTPQSGTLSSCTGLPISSGVSGLGTNVATALGTNVGSAGAFVVNGGALGTPSSGTLSSCSGLPISTGVSGLGTNVATFLATPSSANLAAAVTDETGTGALVFANTPTLVTPNIGAATGTSVNLSGAGTFGGNLTVSGTGVNTFNVGAGTSVISLNSTAASPTWLAFTSGATTLASIARTGNDFIISGGNSGASLKLTYGATQTATITGNLTVSGTGNSSVAGNLGIGTTAPSYILDVQSAAPSFRVKNTTAAGGATRDSTILLEAQNDFSGQTQAYIKGILAGNSGLSTLTFGTAGAAGDTTATERMRITSGGNLLIGGVIDSGNGNLQLKSTSGTAAGGIGFGTDTSLYRYTAGRLGLAHIGGGTPTLYLLEGTTETARLWTANGPCYLDTLTAQPIYFRPNGTTALTLDSSQNATFAGNVTASKAGAAFYSIESTVNGALSEVIIKGKNSLGTAREARLGLNKYADDVFSIYDGTTERFRLNLTNGAATFSGAIAIGNTVNTVSPTSPNRTITMVIGGVTYYLHAKTTND